MLLSLQTKLEEKNKLRKGLEQKIKDFEKNKEKQKKIEKAKARKIELMDILQEIKKRKDAKDREYKLLQEEIGQTTSVYNTNE